MLIRCIAPYTAPDGEVYEKDKTYEVDDARLATLQAWAPGHFVVETQDLVHASALLRRASVRDEPPLTEPPADRQARPRRTR